MEDFILLIGTMVAFIAFILWCCFPVVPKETQNAQIYQNKEYQQQQTKYNQRKSEYCSM